MKQEDLHPYYGEYQALAMRTAKNFGSLQMDLIHAALGIGSEMGELHDVMVKAWLQLPFAPTEISEEIGDASWYAALLCEKLGLNFRDMFITPESCVNADEAFAVAVVNRNPIALSMVCNRYAGEILTLVKANAVYGKPIDTDAIRKYTELFVTGICLLSEAHAISYHLSCLPENIDKLKKRYPDKYSDVAAMERADKKVNIVIPSNAVQ